MYLTSSGEIFNPHSADIFLVCCLTRHLLLGGDLCMTWGPIMKDFDMLLRDIGARDFSKRGTCNDKHGEGGIRICVCGAIVYIDDEVIGTHFSRSM